MCIYNVGLLLLARVDKFLLLGEWITPTVTGDRPPPINQFSLTPVTKNTAILFGGETPNHGGSNNVHIFDFTKTSVVSVLISIINLMILLKD